MDNVLALLQYYSFDLGNSTVKDLVNLWSKYDPNWVRLAFVESLHQGRYKAISISQILAYWDRRGEPHCHFNREFERMICGDATAMMKKIEQRREQQLEQPRPQSLSQMLSQSVPKKSAPRKAATDLPPKALLLAPTRPPLPKPLSPSPIYQNGTIRQINLLADTSLFVDKLRSMCDGPLEIAIGTSTNSLSNGHSSAIASQEETSGQSGEPRSSSEAAIAP